MIQLQENETIQRIYRRHWFVFAVAIAQIGVALVVAFFLPNILSSFISEIAHEYILWTEILSILIAELLWVALFFILTDYYLDVWIVTNERLVFIELRGFFNRTVSSVRLGDIQDISVTVGGIIPTFFQFGDVRIQSAGTHGEFILRQIAKPDEVKNEIMRVRSTREKVAL